MKPSWKLALAAAATASIGFVSVGGAPTAVAATEVHIKQASVADHAGDCGLGSITGAHIVLNQIAGPAPATISVTLSDDSVVVVQLSKQTGKVGHYDVALSAGLTVEDATAMVADGWSGQFVLSHYECGPAPTTTTTSTTMAPTTTSTTTTSTTSTSTTSTSTEPSTTTTTVVT